MSPFNFWLVLSSELSLETVMSFNELMFFIKSSVLFSSLDLSDLISEANLKESVFNLLMFSLIL